MVCPSATRRREPVRSTVADPTSIGSDIHGRTGEPISSQSLRKSRPCLVSSRESSVETRVETVPRLRCVQAYSVTRRLLSTECGAAARTPPRDDPDTLPPKESPRTDPDVSAARGIAGAASNCTRFTNAMLDQNRRSDHDTAPIADRVENAATATDGSVSTVRRDLVLLGCVPFLLVIGFLLPAELQRRLAFRYTDPSVLTAYTAPSCTSNRRTSSRI